MYTVLSCIHTPNGNTSPHPAYASRSCGRWFDFLGIRKEIEAENERETLAANYGEYLMPAAATVWFGCDRSEEIVQNVITFLSEPVLRAPSKQWALGSRNQMTRKRTSRGTACRNEAV